MSSGRRAQPVQRICVDCGETFSQTSMSLSERCRRCRQLHSNQMARQRQRVKELERKATCRKCGGPKPTIVGRRYCDRCHEEEYGRSANQIITCTVCEADLPGTMFRRGQRQCIPCFSRLQRERHLLRTFGITLAQQDLVWKAQGAVCALCQRGDDDLKYGIDHNHRTGEIRGILCSACNYHFLGRFSDPDQFRAAAEYLENPPARGVLS